MYTPHTVLKTTPKASSRLLQDDHFNHCVSQVFIQTLIIGQERCEKSLFIIYDKLSISGLHLREPSHNKSK